MMTYDEPTFFNLLNEKPGGFRLEQLEVYNWGTFNEHIHVLKLEGQNTLLTGDIGSGKSTLVDALTTLLVPPQKIVYNLAAGAERRERSLRSYLLGHYKSTQQTGSARSQAVSLRDNGQYSVILGRFHNASSEKWVTLAQIFWLNNTDSAPERRYLSCEGPLSIKEHLSSLHPIGSLNRRLKAHNIEVHSSFKAYSAWFLRRFNLENEQALELFSRTVSLKSVGNLTEFVQQYMLEPFQVEETIEHLISHFEDLRQAYQAVKQAEAQLSVLKPLMDNHRQFTEDEEQRDSLRQQRDALSAYRQLHEQTLLQQALEHLEQQRLKRVEKVERLETKESELQTQREALRDSIYQSGGGELERLGREIGKEEQNFAKKKERYRRFAELLQQLDETATLEPDVFLQQQQRLRQRYRENERQQEQLTEESTKQRVQLAQAESALKEQQDELESLVQRPSNIPRQQIELRTALCSALELPLETLPFTGELLQVKASETRWQGALERLLHGFGLSLLVPERHYAAVSAWVDQTHLKQRLVYFRVSEGNDQLLRHFQNASANPDRVSSKLEIKQGHSLAQWLAQELERRYPHVCCENLERFRQQERALSLLGQVKSGRGRHEKDDRHALNDRNRYVLGWTNHEKIAALQQDVAKREQQIGDQMQLLNTLDQQKRGLDRQRAALGQLQEYTDLSDLNWKIHEQKIQNLKERQQQLEQASDQLKVLRQQLNELETTLQQTTQQLREQRDKASRTEAKLETHRQQLESINDSLAKQEQPLVPEDSVWQQLKQLELRVFSGQQLQSITGWISREQSLRKELQQQIDKIGNRIQRIENKLIASMMDFQKGWPSASRELDHSLDAVPGYLEIYQRLRHDNLPQFKANFQQRLESNTVTEIATFSAQLRQQQDHIRKRIQQINASLIEIDYAEGHYIQIVEQTSLDTEIRDFQELLKSCMAGSLSFKESATEFTAQQQRFKYIQELIERLRGRKESAEVDRRWRDKVTDVRQWFRFSASERQRSDDQEYDHYTDSSGKSGGQKEKLAYTMLAASLAYQYGLQLNGSRSNSFRLVVIDEAFGRGSDESARYALELFKQFELQLLIVTPLQKVQVIATYVSQLGYVRNPDGRSSQVMSETIDTYYERIKSLKEAALEPLE